ncbi:MAG: Na+/H+ antiporter NhaC family protein [Calditrichaeota bacterium]|nr:MAG: Na+/H+ antiporter NhaC family protein [Calditrichota bacterium]
MEQAFKFEHGQLVIANAVLQKTGSHEITVEAGGISASAHLRVIPGILSLLPPLFAIALAFAARQVLISLFAGIWLGALFIHDYNPFLGFMRTLDTYLINSLADPDHAAILIFSLTLGGMVGVIAKAGGTQGIVEKLSKLANNRRGGQLAAWAMGLFIFFDDYANTLIVGNTMRPFTDRLKISREKLSYIVDSTAAPVASIALISTWIGFQIGLIDQAFNSMQLEHNAYNIFIQSIPYATYSILAIVFVFLLGVTLRDFGPMYTAERRAVTSGKVLRDGAQPIADSTSLDMIADEGTPLRSANALVPIGLVILVTLFGLYFNGKAALGPEAQTARFGQIFGAADSFAVLMWASFTGLFVAALMAMSQKILSLNATISAAVSGYKSMLLAAMILVLAWAIGNICGDLHTADYVINMSKDVLSPHFIPFMTFAVAAFISFSTGSSWATMAILTPIVLPIAHQLPEANHLSAHLSHEILIGTVGAILSGSVLGDHCSPISDTTILSSMASAADHVDHVRTQLPYAVVVAVVASLSGYLPNGWGLNTYGALLLGCLILVGIVFWFGKKEEA